MDDLTFFNLAFENMEWNEETNGLLAEGEFMQPAAEEEIMEWNLWNSVILMKQMAAGQRNEMYAML